MYKIWRLQIAAGCECRKRIYMHIHHAIYILISRIRFTMIHIEHIEIHNLSIRKRRHRRQTLCTRFVPHHFKIPHLMPRISLRFFSLSSFALEFELALLFPIDGFLFLLLSLHLYGVHWCHPCVLYTMLITISHVSILHSVFLHMGVRVCVLTMSDIPFNTVLFFIVYRSMLPATFI